MFAHKLIDKFFQNFQRAVDKINHVHVLLANCKIVEELLQIQSCLLIHKQLLLSIIQLLSTLCLINLYCIRIYNNIHDWHQCIFNLHCFVCGTLNQQQNIVIMKKSGRVQDKENQFPVKESRSNPINDKMLKFGKSIRAKLSQKNQLRNARYSQPLNEETSLINIRQSANLESSKPILPSDVKMSVSYIFPNDDQDGNNTSLSCSRSNLSKPKSVRFSDPEDASSNSLSKSIRKCQSILKNSNSSDKLSSNSVNSHVASISNGLSVKASLKDKGLDCENKKYQSTAKYLTVQNKKFFDDMFPPGGASLFHSKNVAQSRKDIRWMRFEDIFRGQKQILYNHQDRNTVKVGQFPELRYMATCFNAIGTSARCIQRIFENQKYSKLGIYYLRLNHEGIWKYVIVDDYIPVKAVGKTYAPVFLSVCPPKSDYIQLWPFLLQKALAKIYSTYECLFNEKVQNMMQQLTGVIHQRIPLNPDLAESNQLKIKSYMMHKDNILFCSEPIEGSGKNLKQQFYAMDENKKSSSTYFSQQTEIKIFNIDRDKQPVYLLLENLHQYFGSVLVFRIDDSYYSVGCVIKQQKGTMSLRTFKVSSYGSCSLAVIQKDRKYFRNNGYEYCWMRVLLVCKDIDGYRYINGAYNNSKIVTISATLSPGEYFVLVNGEWGKKVYDVTLNYQGNIQAEIKREPISKFGSIIPEMCRDIAQRFGNFAQLNKNVCSYQYADRQNGLIIQNFNNEMERQVYFHRIYKIPFRNFVSVGNAKFVEDQNSGSMKKKKTHEIETFLQADANITLVLMLLGGISEEQFASFSFSGF